MSTADDHLLMDQLRLAQDDQHLLGGLLSSHRARLRSMVDFRMHQQLRGRIDASDIVQDTMLEATQRLPEFLQSQSVPFYVWLRTLATQRMALAVRQHIGTKARDARRETPLFSQPLPDATSMVLMAALIGTTASPSSMAVQEEQKRILNDAIATLDPIDQEIIVLRHFEEMSNVEAAATLDLKPSAAANRYLRSLERLRQALARVTDHPSQLA